MPEQPTLPQRPTRLQQLQADAAAICWLYLTPQPGGIATFAEYQRRVRPVHEAIAEELERLRACPDWPDWIKQAA